MLGRQKMSNPMRCDSHSLATSAFNHIVSADDQYILGNFFTGALAFVHDPNIYRVLRHGRRVLSASEAAAFSGPQKDLAISNGFLIPQGYDEKSICRLQYMTARYDRSTLTLTLLPTMSCNFACPYCYEEDKLPGVMERRIADAVITYIEQQVQRGVRTLHVVWYGGEPLLAYDVILNISEQILDLTKKNSVKYRSSLTTNGYLLTQRRALELSRLGIDFAQVTLDGPPEQHNARRPLRGGGATYDAILTNILACQNTMRIAVRINIDADNVGSLQRLFSDFEGRVTGNVGFYAEAVGPTSCYTERCLDRQTYGSAATQVYRQMLRHGLRPLYDANVRAVHCLAECSGSLVIDPNGDCYKCWADLDTADGRASMRIGNIVDAAWHIGLIARWATNDPFADPKCSACQILPLCLGGCPRVAVFEQRRHCATAMDWGPDEYLKLLALQQGVGLPIRMRSGFYRREGGDGDARNEGSGENRTESGL